MLIIPGNTSKIPGTLGKYMEMCGEYRGFIANLDQMHNLDWLSNLEQMSNLERLSNLEQMSNLDRLSNLEQMSNLGPAQARPGLARGGSAA